MWPLPSAVGIPAESTDGSQSNAVELEKRDVEFANVIWMVYLIGAAALIIAGMICYRSRLEIGSKGPKSIGQWIWYIIVAEIAWFVYVSVGLHPGF